MKKVILIFVTIVLSGLLYAKDNKSTDALLREIDGIIKNRQAYGAEKEARIADLKKLLVEATSDEQRYGFWIRLLSMLNGKRNWRIAWINWIIWMMLP